MLVNCTTYADGRKLPNTALEDVPMLRDRPDVFVWLGLREPDEDLMARVQDLFGLHELAAEDAHHAHQRPKVELYGDCLFVALKTAQMNAGKVDFG